MQPLNVRPALLRNSNRYGVLFANSRSVLYGQELADPARMRIGLNIVRHKTMAQFSNYVIDMFIGPNVSSFTRAEIPDMSTYDNESDHWVANFFLNSVFRAAWKPPYNAYMYNYLRRAEAAFTEHHTARTETLAFIESGRQSTKRYTAALFHWETFLGQSWHAYRTLQKCFDVKLYKPGEGSVEERLNHLYNQMKHVESRIENKQILEGATVPVWLTNQGLVSVDSVLMFGETGEVLKDIAKWANILQAPLSTPEKLKDMPM